MASQSAGQIAKELSINASPRTISKTIRQIVKKMGLSSVRELIITEKSESKTTATKLRHMIEAQGYRCALSGEELDPDNASLDHKTPIANGGTNDIENLQWLHVQVNAMKGTLSQERFVTLCRKVAQWNS